MKSLLTSFASVILVSLVPVQVTVAQQDPPVCQFADSDPDGDGYGWENRTSCIMTEQSTLPSITACIDDDGDGYGWNGREVCRVDVAECHDSDPIGDGWGWNGVTSCQLPVYPAPFSELEILRSQNRTLRGASVAAATVICTSPSNTVHVYDLHEDGRVTYSSDISNNTGAWSTGFSDSDGIIEVIRINFSSGSTFRDRILMLQPGSIGLRYAGPSENTDNCIWAI